MHDILKQIESIGIVPVVKINRATAAVPLAQALCDGGLPCAEVTFRTDAAAEAIRAMTAAFPDMLVGAGTVLTTQQADDAIAAGAKFIVSPGLNPKVVSHCVSRGYPITPGVATPSEIEQALALGLDVVKFFPAEAAGGLPMIKAMSAPYGKLKFMPTGGINANNLRSYLEFPKIIACGGSWMVKSDLLDTGDFDAIRDLTRQAVETMLGFRLLHVGINCDDPTHAADVADTFQSLFGFAATEGRGSFFNGDAIEVMKTPGPGVHGHIAIGTPFVSRAVAYLQRRGVAFDWDSALYDGAQQLKFIYLAQPVAGFAIHLKQI